MAFLEILKELVDNVKGGLAATVMGVDGIAIEQYIGESRLDVETVGVEYGKVIEEIRNASRLLNLGEVEEVLVATAGNDLLLRLVNHDYYIAFVAGPEANIGQARYLLKRAAAKTAKELER
ncbi:MAG: roadblock/LC7 domain-containing protein [Deltaproteobacteria bacterium]|nr:roadblock/LC7 domain-containing protein [Deltaproteobacteria bacterium]